jgi:type III secretory pathway component EscS
MTTATHSTTESLLLLILLVALAITLFIAAPHLTTALQSLTTDTVSKPVKVSL